MTIGNSAWFSWIGFESNSFGERPGLLCVLVLLLAGAIMSHGIGKGEFHLNTDEAFDATSGLFVADFLRDMPISHPVRYTYEYYAQYPALGIVHWPPFFHFVEALMFLVFGATVVVARMTVILFALTGLYFWFRLVHRLQGSLTAVVSTLTFACLPAILLYEKAVMLEIPSLALSIAAIYYWTVYLEDERSRNLYIFAIYAALALLSKQQSVFVAVFCVFTVFAFRKWKAALRVPTIWAALIVLLIAGPFYALDLSIDRQSVSANLMKGVEANQNRFTYYLRALPHQLGWALLILSIVGMASVLLWSKKKSAVVMFCWMCAWYLTYLVITTKTFRYMIYWLPPFIFFATAALTSEAFRKGARIFSTIAALGLAAGFVWIGWTYQRPYVTGGRAMAAEVIQRERGGVILYDGDLTADYIFFMRALDPGRHFVVLRKALYSTRVMRAFGSVDLVHNSGDIEDILSDYGIRYIVIEKNAPIEFAPQQLLRDLLCTPQFKLVRSIPIESNQATWNSRTLLLYENLKVQPPTSQYLHLSMLSMDHDIVVPLADLLKE